MSISAYAKNIGGSVNKGISGAQLLTLLDGVPGVVNVMHKIVILGTNDHRNIERVIIKLYYTLPIYLLLGRDSACFTSSKSVFKMRLL